VRLGRIVHDDIVSRDNAVEKINIADVTHHELDLRLRETSNILWVTRVRKLVKHGHVTFRMVRCHPAHEVATYEATAARDNDVLGFEAFGHGYSSPKWRSGAMPPSATVRRCCP